MREPIPYWPDTGQAQTAQGTPEMVVLVVSLMAGVEADAASQDKAETPRSAMRAGEGEAAAAAAAAAVDAMAGMASHFYRPIQPDSGNSTRGPVVRQEWWEARVGRDGRGAVL